MPSLFLKLPGVQHGRLYHLQRFLCFVSRMHRILLPLPGAVDLAVAVLDCLAGVSEPVAPLLGIVSDHHGRVEPFEAGLIPSRTQVTEVPGQLLVKCPEICMAFG